MTNPLSSLAHRTARWCALHPWRAILGWVAFVAIAVGMAALIPTQETTDEDGRLGDSGRAAAMIDAGRFDDADTEQVLITSASGDLDRAEAQDAAAAVVAGMTALEEVDAVAEPQASPDGRRLPRLGAAGPRPGRRRRPAGRHAGRPGRPTRSSTSAQSGDVSLDVGHRRPGRRRPRLGRDAQPPDHADPDAAGLRRPDRRRPARAARGHERRRHDRRRSRPISHLVHAESTVTSMIVLIGMAVGVDYSLFYLKREREERAKGRSGRDAVEIAAQTSGHSILVSGTAVICSMAGLFLIGDSTFNSLAIGSIVVVAVAVLGSITVLPALLAKLGRWVDRPRVPLLHRLTRRMGPRRHQRSRPGPGHPPPARGARAARRWSSCSLAIPALGHEDAQRQPRDAADLDPGGADDARPQRGVPLRGHHRRPGRAGATAGQQADVADGAERAWRPPRSTPVTSGRRASRSRCRPTAGPSVLTLGMPYDESDDRVDAAIRELRDRPGAGGAGRSATSSTPSAVTRRSPWTSWTGSRSACRSSSGSCCC